MSSTPIDAALCDLHRDIDTVCTSSAALRDALAGWTLTIHQYTSIQRESFVLEIVPISDPESMRAAWKAYAEEWNRVAGDRVIWQLGLRGRGDRPLWNHDPDAAKHAARLFSAAFEDQMNIIREVDSREMPPATITLWLEVSRLMQAGDIRLPPNVIRVFADDHMSQEMREDFHTLPRDPDLAFYLSFKVINSVC